MKSNPIVPADRADHSAFTLTELIIAMAVLTMLMVFVAQLVNSATIVTTGSRKRMDADSQARLVFDRLSGDFGKMLRRSDVDYLFSKQTGNDRMFFYSEAPAYYDDGSSSFKLRNSVALIGYRINMDHQLERLGKQLSWGGATGAGAQPGSVVFLTYPPATPATPKPAPLPTTLLENNWATVIGSAPDYVGTDDAYRVFADQVCRWEFCFQMKDGSYKFDPAGGTATTIHSLKDVAAIVIGMAVLDTNSQQIADMTRVSDALTDPKIADLQSNPPVLIAERWRQQLFTPGFAQSAGLPQTAASQIRIYERHFYLHAP